MSFFEISWYVAQGILAYYIIVSLGRWLLGWIDRLFMKRHYRDWHTTLNELWNRQRDTQILVEEIHAILTRKIPLAELPNVQKFMLRGDAKKAGDIKNWEEKSIHSTKSWTHFNSSEIEDFIVHSAYRLRTSEERQEMISRLEHAICKPDMLDDLVGLSGDFNDSLSVHWTDFDWGPSIRQKEIEKEFREKSDRSKKTKSKDQG